LMENLVNISSKKLLYLLRKKVSVLFVLVFVASAALIFINYYTIKTTSAVRSYINGESEYSKGQKDALLYLLTYTQTTDEKYWLLFKQALDVPIGDNLARKKLMTDGDVQLIKDGFLRGKNHPADLDEMIWLFQNFKSVSFMKEAIQIWQDAEPFINQLASIGDEINQKNRNGTLTGQRKQELVKEINDITTQLTSMERAFSNVLGAAARTINVYLFYTNIFFIILIVGSIVSYAIIMIKRLMRSEQALIDKNINLTSLNHELDNFVNIVSHDLRAPIASLKGLLQLTLEEADTIQVKEYLRIMDGVIDRQDVFIKEIIEFSRNKLTAVFIEKLNLESIIDDAVTQNEYTPEAKGITIKKEIYADTVYSDALRMKVIINNLISNAIKYSDDKKHEKQILIKTGMSSDGCFITVEDNGIGINATDHERIFDMFFGTKNNRKSTGLGLYITKETVLKLNGSIKVESVKNVGSRFIINFPYQDGKMN
ncbi:MAG: HAMP domain-containing sensor histidine kinase, partial [Panacibacter sp.]